MQLTNIVLRNFRNHRSSAFDFTEGVTAIIGGNGSGKSSIVEAILFLFTGEGYSNKADMLTVGQTGGWVIGKMLIDGKEAVLERHIDTAKVNFMYDGKTYKKSGEVNEIWDKLFQIDKNIVHNVIVSNQGEIALLFNGDNSTKEKLFQKIFMVPNTTKIRDTIWNNYIKDAPPEYPIKDTIQISSDIQCLEQLVSMSESSLTHLVVDEEAYTSLVARQAFLRSVEQAQDDFNRFTSEQNSSQTKLDALTAEVDALHNKMQIINIQEYRECLANQKASKSIHENRLQLETRKAALVEPSAPVISKEELDKLQQKVADLDAGLKVKRTSLQEIQQKIQEYEKSGLGSGVCPTCGSEVDNVVKLIEHLENERTPIIEAGKREKALFLEATEELKSASSSYIAWEDYNKEYAALESALGAYRDVVPFDAEAYELCSSVVVKYTNWEDKLKTLERQKTQASTELNAINVKLAGLAKYDKSLNELAAEKASVQDKITQILNTREEAKKLEIEIAANKREIKSLQAELKDNNKYVEENAKRKEYVAVLRGVYDLFHTGKFPRALIQTYSSTVSEYMNDVLSSFDFPYTAKVNEQFGIDIFNEDGLQLPDISGGQQVMVGFSLRLALHNMFVGAFPFMIVDEGSYGLNSENAKKYFEIIKSLGKSSKFKQVIVIDHHSELSEYVDNTIQL
jgi:DNA repair exonuclease SbcCD ATPase subunit